MDARRCISYLTIEHRGSFTDEEGAWIGDHLFGCDICLEVCPWNRFARTTAEPDFRPRPETMARTATEWRDGDDDACEPFLRGSAMRRARADGLRRNAARILRNRGDRT